MILKLLAFIAVLFVVYLIFFKKSRENNISRNKKKKDEICDEMVACPSCSTFISQKEAILSNGKFYCSKECLDKK